MFPFDDAVDFILAVFWALLIAFVLSAASVGFVVWWLFA